MKKIAFFDLDKTVFDGSSMQRFLFGYLIPQRKIGFLHGVQALVLVFRYATRLISHNNASQKTIEITAQVLNGKTTLEVAAWVKDFFTKEDMFPHIPEVFTHLQKNGYEIYIVSASILPVVQACADVFGVKCIASELVVTHGKYTGMIKHLMNEAEKAAAVASIAGTDINSTLGVGDSTGDLAMLQAVGHGFLFEPFEKSLPAVAQRNGIKLVDRHTMLSALKKITQ